MTPEQAAAVARTHLKYLLLAPLIGDEEPFLSVHASTRGAYVVGCDMRIRAGVTTHDAPLYDASALSDVIAPGRSGFLYHPVRGAAVASGHQMMTSRGIAQALKPAIGFEETFWSDFDDFHDLSATNRLKLRHDPEGCLVISCETDDTDGIEEPILAVLPSHRNPIEPMFVKRRFGRQAQTALEKARTCRIAAKSPRMAAMAEQDEDIWLFEKTVIDNLARRGAIHGTPDSSEIYVALGSPDSLRFLEDPVIQAESGAIEVPSLLMR